MLYRLSSVLQTRLASSDLDRWSDNSTSMQMALFNDANKQLVLAGEKPKPRFLENLQLFLSKELKSLGATTVEPNEVRLQVGFVTVYG